MASTTLTDVQLELQAVAREFAQREIRPVAAHHDETESFPTEVFVKAAEIGLTCYDIPEEFGGGGVARTTCSRPASSPRSSRGATRPSAR